MTEQLHRSADIWEACPKCNGDGYINKHANFPDVKCSACNGTGERRYIPADAQTVGAPVAYRWRIKGDNRWTLLDHYPEGAMNDRSECEPLFASQPSPAATVEMFKCNCPYESRSGCSVPKCTHYTPPRLSAASEPVAYRWRSIFNDNSWSYGEEKPPEHEQYVTEPLFSDPQDVDAVSGCADDQGLFATLDEPQGVSETFRLAFCETCDGNTMHRRAAIVNGVQLFECRRCTLSRPHGGGAS